MAELTDRLELYKPGGGLSGTNLPDEVADIDKLNDNFDKIDAAIGWVLCTSTTRPTSPFDGQPAYERDTKRAIVYDESLTDWTYLTPGATGITDFKVADKAARDLVTGMIEGDILDQADNETRWRYDGAKWRCLTSGLIPIIPESATGTGVTIDARGKVTFAASSEISLNGCFTDEFDYYRMILDIASTTASVYPLCRMRKAGATNVSTIYDSVVTYHSAGAFAIAASNSANYAALGVVTSTDGHQVIAEILNPALPVPTNFQFQSQPASKMGVGVFAMTGTAKHRLATSHDGLTIVPSNTATMNGSLRIYGYS